MQKKRKNALPNAVLRLLYGGCAAIASLCLVISAQPTGVYAYTDTETESYSTYSRTAEDNAEILYKEESGVYRSADEADGGRAERLARLTYNLPGVSNKSVWAHTRLTTKVNGTTLSEPSLVINGITYVPLRSFASALGIKASYSSSTRTMTLSASGLYLTASDGAFVTYANSRPLFSFSPNVIMSNGRMYIPGSTLSKALGLKLDYVSSASVSYSGAYKPLAAASSYYREDEVLWLARIIYAEAGGESLLGQIAVGDVILNRVKSNQFPNTIYGVIFDRRYGVQFSPVSNGTIYNTPSYTATLAAKICLEGTSLTDTAMYFLNPRIATSSWIANNRPYVYTIGGHDFYE